MTRNQIYGVVNNLNKMTTSGVEKVINHETFVSFGEALNSVDGMKDVVYNALIDLALKTVIAIDDYESSNRNITRLPFEFGALLLKISYKLQDAESNSDWEFPTGKNPYEVEPKGGIIQKAFKRKLGVWEYSDVAMTRQLNSAFKSEEEFASFVDGLYQRARVSRELAKENLENVTVGVLVCEVYDNEVNASRRTRHMFAEFSELHPDTTLTKETAKYDYEYLSFVASEMAKTLPFMAKPTLMYNDGTVERVTKEKDLIVEMVNEFAINLDIYLKSNTYHENLISMPHYNTVPYWENPSAPYDIVHGEDETEISCTDIFAIFRDKDACACTMEYERTISKYDEWNDRVPFKMTCERNYMIDPSENVIIWCND